MSTREISCRALGSCFQTGQPPTVLLAKPRKVGRTTVWLYRAAARAPDAVTRPDRNDPTALVALIHSGASLPQT